MKRLVICILIMVFICSILFAEDNTDKNASNIGLAVGLDYYSLYLWRGTKSFNGDGGFNPYVKYNVLGSDLKVSIIGEIADSYLFDGMRKNQKRYVVTSTTISRKRRMNHTAYANEALDFGLEYSYSIDKIVTFGAGLWYYWYFNSCHAKELARTRSDDYDFHTPVNISFMSGILSASIDSFPSLKPSITIVYDYYTAIRRGGDIYTQFGIGHDFELTKEFKTSFGLTAGYFFQKSVKTSIYILNSSYPSGIRVRRIPVKKGFSDIASSVSFNFEKGPIALSSSFNWVIVPAKTWYKGDDVHRFFAKLGAGYKF